MATTLPNQFFTLTPSGFQRVSIHIDPCGDADAQLRTLANSTPTVTPRMFMGPSGPAHVAVTAAAVTIFTVVPKFNLTTTYASVTVAGRQLLKPVFAEVRGAVRMSPEWTPPSNMKVWFVSVLPITSGAPKYARSNLIATCTNEGVNGAFWLPLPNIYNTGKLCLGSEASTVVDIHPNTTTPLDRVFMNALNLFHSSSWNSDLLHTTDEGVRNRLFLFDPATNKVAVSPTDWQTWLPRLSNEDYNNLPLNNPIYHQ